MQAGDVSVIINNPQHWLARAQEARAMADQIDDREVKKAMFAIAESYEKIATRADLRKSSEESETSNDA
jgi:hypothetical protein